MIGHLAVVGTENLGRDRVRSMVQLLDCHSSTGHRAVHGRRWRGRCETRFIQLEVCARCADIDVRGDVDHPAMSAARGRRAREARHRHGGARARRSRARGRDRRRLGGAASARCSRKTSGKRDRRRRRLRPRRDGRDDGGGRVEADAERAMHLARRVVDPVGQAQVAVAVLAALAERRSRSC